MYRKKKDHTEDCAQLGNLLERYKKRFKPPQASVAKECLIIIKKVSGIELSLSQVEYVVSTKTLIIKAPSLVRSELKTHSDKILSASKEVLGSSAPVTLL